MDPPKKFDFNLDFDSFWWKLKMTSLVFCFNSVVVLLLVTIAYYMLDQKTIWGIVRDYSNNNKTIFAERNWANFSIFLYSYCISSPIVEEFIYRYPVILLLKNNFRVKTRGKDITKILLWVIIFTLLSIWTHDHLGNSEPLWKQNYYHLLPVFLAGIPLYWLAIKTQVLWPVILCHGALNLGLYLLVQLMIHFEFDPVFTIALLLNALRALQPISH